jgi:hypothetical protein
VYSMRLISFLRHSSSFEMKFSPLNCSLFFTAGPNEWNGFWPIMENRITGKHHVLNSRGRHFLEGHDHSLWNIQYVTEIKSFRRDGFMSL